MKKFVSVLLLIFATVIFATWQYRLLCVLFFVWINRTWIKSWPLMKRRKYAFKGLVAMLMLGIFFAIPNYFQRGDIQLVYLDDEGNAVKPPLPVYIANAIMPEEEACNLCIKATAITPPSGINLFGFHLGSRLVTDARNDFWDGKMFSFYEPYNDISWRMSNPGSPVYGQLWNSATADNLDAIYVQDNRPLYLFKHQPMPVVFFCHGFLGNWELYQGFLSGLEDCLVVSIGTRDVSGIFTHDDINRIFTRYLPYIESKGYGVDMSAIHLIGLSNGGSASNVALAGFSERFKTITYISTSCDVIKHTDTKVLLIGGGQDYSSRGLKNAHQQLKRCGTPSAIFFDEDENHYMMMHKKMEVLDFLNKEIRY